MSKATAPCDGSTLEQATPPRAPTTTIPDDLVGRSLLHFRIVARLGAGGMGVVYKAFDDKLRRTIAVKVLGPRYVVDDRNKELIFREARSAAGLNHPNIAAIYELHESPEGAFYVMELVEGDTLRERIGRAAPPVDEVLRWAQQIARALSHAHQAGIVHRDLKSDNVMITRAGEVKLLDFGLAKVVELGEPVQPNVADQPAAHAATIVARGTLGGGGRVLGTPAYMAPEQARGEEVDARADVFAFGVVLYEMITGASPFPARTGVPSGDSDSGDWKIQARVGELVPRAPRAIDGLVQRCLAFDRAARYADGAALVTAVEACASRPPKWGRYLVVTLVLVVATLWVILHPAGASKAPLAATTNTSVADAAPPPPDSTPSSDAQRARAQIVTILDQFVAWSPGHAGDPCPDHDELTPLVDPWGHRFVITCSDQPAGQRIGVLSLGPDGIRDTADDIASWSLDEARRVQGPRWRPRPAAVQRISPRPSPGPRPDAAAQPVTSPPDAPASDIPDHR